VQLKLSDRRAGQHVGLHEEGQLPMSTIAASQIEEQEEAYFDVEELQVWLLGST